MATLVDASEHSSEGQDTNRHQLNGSAHWRPSRAALSPKFWRESSLRQFCEDALSPIEMWEAYWKIRRRPTSVARLCRSESTPLSWALRRHELSPAAREVLAVAHQPAHGKSQRLGKNAKRDELRNAMGEWLDEVGDAAPSWQLGVGCLAAVHVMGEAGRQCGVELGWELLDFLYAAALHAQGWRSDGSATADEDLAQQLLAGELPLTLSYYFSEMAPFKTLRESARDRLSEGILNLLNDDGLVAASHLSVMRSLSASWTRCCAIGRKLRHGTWTKAAESRYQLLVRQAVRWSDPEGRPLLQSAQADPWEKDLLATALRLGGRKADAAASRMMLASHPRHKSATAKHARLPAPAYHSENSALGVMRCNWSSASPVVAVDYSARTMRIDACVGRQRLFDGPWIASLQVDGRSVEPAGDWEERCWFTDKDVDYLEFSLKLEGDALLERQVLLARQDGWLMLADHLKNPIRADLRYVGDLPLCQGVEFHEEAETRDGLCSAKAPVARVIPPALPEWRVDPRLGEVTTAGSRLRLSQRSQARVLACPLFFDLNRTRISKPCTWRQLTVAESLINQPSDVAIGYRIQCGTDQWVIYRSQGPVGNRTLLGQNTASDFFAARFLAKSGSTRTLLEIEG